MKVNVSFHMELNLLRELGVPEFYSRKIFLKKERPVNMVGRECCALRCCAQSEMLSIDTRMP